MKFELPNLPYALDALAPNISAETLEYHHGKHHAAYVTNLNNLIAGTPFEEMSLEEIIKKSDGGVFNNAAQVYNHTFYWNCLSPKGGDSPKGLAAEEIARYFGSFAEFRDKFSKAAVTLFGSGWVWLVRNENGSLSIEQMSNAHNPLASGKKPILTIDVWEHAYYIDYRNARPAYIEKFWNLVNWDFVNQNLKA